MKNTIQLYSFQIMETAKRPDIIICSESVKIVVLIDLTVPIKQNLADANLRKKCKYSELVAECENRSWTTHYFPVDMVGIGSRGFYNTSLPKCRKGKRKKIIDRAAKAALRGSCAIWLSRNSKAFQKMILKSMPNINSEREVRRLWRKTILIHQSGPKPRDL